MISRRHFSPVLTIGLFAGLLTGTLFSQEPPRIEFKVIEPPPVEATPFQSSSFPGTSAFQPRPVSDLLEAQIALDRIRISCGSIDGVFGAQTQSALRAYQRSQYLRVTGELDQPTRESLILDRPPFTTTTVTPSDLASLRPTPATWVAKSEIDRLAYASVLEMAAERGHSSPKLIRALNPEVDWDRVEPGTVLKIPDARRPPETPRASMILIHLEGKTLQAYDESGRILMHFPCSIAQRVEKRPVGQIEVKVLVYDPNYTFDPAVFPESAEAREIKRKLIIPPGPNNPVGLAWIGLSLPGYGMHGTPEPEKVGRTESHGCFRLANWNATSLVKASWVGMPVYVEP